MSSWLKKHGMKIGIKFTKNLIGDVSGLTPEPVGGYKTGNAINESDNPVFSQSSYYSVFTGDRAFDGDTSTYWYTRLSGAQWLQVNLGSGRERAVTKLRLYSSGYRPRNFVLEGSRDTVIWDTLCEGEYLDETSWQEWNFENYTKYRYYRLIITSRWGLYLWVNEVELFYTELIGTEQAFTVTGKEPRWVKFPSEELGPLVDVNYEVESVEAYPDLDPTKILLTMKPSKRFQNLEGDLTVSYNAYNGNLKGLGGIVQSFEQVFAPTDLERRPNPKLAEYIAASIANYDLILRRIYYMVVGDGDWPTDDNRSIKYVREYDAGPPEVQEQQKGLWGGTNNEKISASIANYTITLIHVDNLEP